MATMLDSPVQPDSNRASTRWRRGMMQSTAIQQLINKTRTQQTKPERYHSLDPGALHAIEDDLEFLQVPLRRIACVAQRVTPA